MANLVTGKLKIAWNFLVDGEIFILLFLIVGQFKAAVPTVLFIDTTLLIMLLATACLLRRWIVKKEKIIETSSVVLFGSFAGLVMFAGISMLHTSTPQYGFSKLMDLIFLNGWVIIAAAGLIRSRKSVYRLCVMWVVWGVFIAVNTIINAIVSQGTRDIAPLTTNYISASVFIYSACLICWVLYLRIPRKHILLATYSVLLAGGFLLAARSTFLLFFILFAMITISCLTIKTGKAAKLGLLRVVLSSAVIFVILFVSGAFSFLFARLDVILPEDVTLTEAFGHLRESVVSGSVSGSGESDIGVSHIGDTGYVVCEVYDAGIEGEVYIIRDPIYLNAPYVTQQRMNYIERYYPLIFSRIEYDRLNMPLSFDHTLYNIARGGTSRWDLLLVSITAVSYRAVTGWGLGGFALVLRNMDGVPVWPHNLFLEVWLEMGVFALIPLAIFLIYPLYMALYHVIKRHRDTTQFLVLISIMLFWMGFSMFSNLVEGLRVLYVILAIVCSSALWGNGLPRNPVQLRIDAACRALGRLMRKPKKDE